MNMRQELKIAIISTDIVPENPEANLSELESALAGMDRKVDVVVLPELFSTGFVSDPQRIEALAEPLSGNTLKRLHSLASKYSCAISGSFLCKIANMVVNRAFFVEPGGDETFYDKHHLFSLSPEKNLLKSGVQACPIIRFRGWNLSMIVCYDLRFPAWCRNVGNAYDVLLVPANWPQVRSYAWKHLLIARAIENQAYVVGANRSGNDNYGCYDGLSFVFGPTGENVGENIGNITYATAIPKSVEDIRRRLPVINDADSYTFI